jgi:hypothetical protein
MRRLHEYVKNQKLILRTIANTRLDYEKHLGEISDWSKNKESPLTVADIKELLPDRVWMVEVSIPDLFSTNKRKLGELLLDATRPFSSKADDTMFVMARLPGVYAFFNRRDGRNHPLFLSAKSRLQSHTPLQEARAANC